LLEACESGLHDHSHTHVRRVRGRRRGSLVWCCVRTRRTRA
jgi:hypothetical protein